MSFDIWEQHIINIYLSNFDSSGNSCSLGTISCYPKISEMCSGFEICYPKYSLGVQFWGYSGSGFLGFALWVRFLCLMSRLPPTVALVLVVSCPYFLSPLSLVGPRMSVGHACQPHAFTFDPTYQLPSSRIAARCLLRCSMPLPHCCALLPSCRVAAHPRACIATAANPFPCATPLSPLPCTSSHPF
jgi:hypothetical protein